MKLKYNFVIRDIGGSAVAAAVGKDSASFKGMIKLNGTGKFIFERLSEDTAAEDIATALTREYGISEDEAKAAVTDFTDRLRDSGLLSE